MAKRLLEHSCQVAHSHLERKERMKERELGRSLSQHQAEAIKKAFPIRYGGPWTLCVRNHHRDKTEFKSLEH